MRKTPKRFVTKTVHGVHSTRNAVADIKWSARPFIPIICSDNVTSAMAMDERNLPVSFVIYDVLFAVFAIPMLRTTQSVVKTERLLSKAMCVGFRPKKWGTFSGISKYEFSGCFQTVQTAAIETFIKHNENGLINRVI